MAIVNNQHLLGNASFRHLVERGNVALIAISQDTSSCLHCFSYPVWNEQILNDIVVCRLCKFLLPFNQYDRAYLGHCQHHIATKHPAKYSQIVAAQPPAQQYSPAVVVDAGSPPINQFSNPPQSNGYYQNTAQRPSAPQNPDGGERRYYMHFGSPSPSTSQQAPSFAQPRHPPPMQQYPRISVDINSRVPNGYAHRPQGRNVIYVDPAHVQRAGYQNSLRQAPFVPAASPPVHQFSPHSPSFHHHQQPNFQQSQHPPSTYAQYSPMGSPQEKMGPPHHYQSVHAQQLTQYKYFDEATGQVVTVVNQPHPRPVVAHPVQRYNSFDDGLQRPPPVVGPSTINGPIPKKNDSPKKRRRCGVCQGCMASNCETCSSCLYNKEIQAEILADPIAHAAAAAVKVKRICLRRRCVIMLESWLQREVESKRIIRHGCGCCDECEKADCNVCCFCVDREQFSGAYFSNSLCRRKKCISVVRKRAKGFSDDDPVASTAPAPATATKVESEEKQNKRLERLVKQQARVEEKLAKKHAREEKVNQKKPRLTKARKRKRSRRNSDGGDEKIDDDFIDHVRHDPTLLALNETLLHNAEIKKKEKIAKSELLNCLVSKVQKWTPQGQAFAHVLNSDVMDPVDAGEKVEHKPEPVSPLPERQKEKDVDLLQAMTLSEKWTKHKLILVEPEIFVDGILLHIDANEMNTTVDIRPTVEVPDFVVANQTFGPRESSTAYLWHSHAVMVDPVAKPHPQSAVVNIPSVAPFADCERLLPKQASCTLPIIRTIPLSACHVSAIRPTRTPSPAVSYDVPSSSGRGHDSSHCPVLSGVFPQPFRSTQWSNHSVASPTLPAENCVAEPKSNLFENITMFNVENRRNQRSSEVFSKVAANITQIHRPSSSNSPIIRPQPVGGDVESTSLEPAVTFPVQQSLPVLFDQELLNLHEELDQFHRDEFDSSALLS